MSGPERWQLNELMKLTELKLGVQIQISEFGPSLLQRWSQGGALAF